MFQNIFAQQYGSFKDSRDGRVYKTVKIGSQVWMAEDLMATTFLNGDPIINAESNYEWNNARRDKTPAWSKTEAGNSKTYNGFALVDKRGICPKGFHIPSYDDFDELALNLGGYENAGFKLKSTSGWGKYHASGGIKFVTCSNCASWSDEYKRKVPCHKCKDKRVITIETPKIYASGDGNNQSGFSAKPGGGRHYNGVWDEGSFITNQFWAYNTTTNKIKKFFIYEFRKNLMSDEIEHNADINSEITSIQLGPGACIRCLQDRGGFSIAPSRVRDQL